MTGLESPGNKDFTIGQAIDFFKSRLAAYDGESRRSYGKALSSLTCYAAARCSGSDPLDGALLADWYVAGRLQGLSAKTAAFYLDKIGSLYGAAVKSGLAADTSIAGDLKARVRQLDVAGAAMPALSDAALGRLTALSSALIDGMREGAPAEYAMLMALAAGCMPLKEVASLRREGVDALGSAARAIAARVEDTRRRYVFPLDQTRQTPRQVAEALGRDVAACMRRLGLPVCGEPDEALRTLWALLALRCGVAPSSVVGALGAVPAGLPVMSLCVPARDGEGERADIAEAVGQMLAGESRRWFAMRLRPRVKFDSVVERFARQTDMKMPETFYPCEEIARRIGRKLVWADRPVIPDVVFFRSRMTDVWPLMQRVYDLAWCYRDDRGPAGHYAAIPDRAMADFQQAIGFFRPGFEVAPAGQLPIGPDDEVVIVGGDFARQQGRVVKLDSAEADHIVYRVMLHGAPGSWNVGVDARLLRRV